MNVHVVDAGHVHKIWPLVEGYIASALEHSKGDYTVESAKTLIATGQWMLLVAADETGIHGAATLYMFNRPHDRVAFVTAIGGKLIGNAETFEQLKQILANFGATTIEGAARESIARLWRRLGFQEKYKIVEVKL
jgi:hypothetical protein